VATTRKGKAYIFDLSHPEDKPQELDAYNGPPNAEPNAEAITFAPDGKSFVTGCQKCLRLWECSTGKLIKELNGSAANINSAVFSPDGKSLATVDSDGTLALWNPVVGKLDQTTKAHSGCSFCVAFSPDGSQIATIGRDENTAKIWDAHSLTMVTMLQRTNVSNRVQ
jgi:WD40 repeat protein